MGFPSKKLRKGGVFVISFSMVCLVLSIWCLLLLLNAYLPDVAPGAETVPFLGSYKLLKPQRTEDVRFSEFGEMMVAMLPEDLAFTIFMPSEKAFKLSLKLNSKDSLREQNVNTTFAILSRVMGFTTVPQHLSSQAVPMQNELPLDSVSGFKLYAHKLSDGTLVVNNVHAEQVDLRRGEIIVHIMDGVIMDSEFEMSFRSDYED